jgi:NADH-quinone oxidoreductase subunit J
MLTFFNIILTLNCFFASLVVFSKNVVYSLMCLNFVVVGSCLILFFLRLEFIVFILLLVYVGAIAVLFLFVILMLRFKEKQQLPQPTAFGIKLFVYLVMLVKINFVVYFFNKQVTLLTANSSYEYIKQNTDLAIFNYTTGVNDTAYFLNIYTQKYSFFIVIGLILVLSLVGAISLSTKAKN